MAASCGLGQCFGAGSEGALTLGMRPCHRDGKCQGSVSFTRALFHPAVTLHDFTNIFLSLQALKIKGGWGQGEGCWYSLHESH